MHNMSFSMPMLSCTVCILAIALFLHISRNDSSESVDVESSVEVSASNLPDFVPVDFDILNREINRIYVWTDEETGVQYIVYAEKCANAGFGGITPRLNADGSLYVLDEEEVTPPAVAAE